MAENLISDEEFQDTAQIVENFRHKEGPKIQAYLEKRQARSLFRSFVHVLSPT